MGYESVLQLGSSMVWGLGSDFGGGDEDIGEKSKER